MPRAINFDPTTKTKLKSFVLSRFPDAKDVADDPGMLTGVAMGIVLDGGTSPVDLSAYQKRLERIARRQGVVSANRSITQPTSNKRGVRYYEVRAIHDRQKPDLDPFTGRLTMARVTLPERRAKNIDTGIGDILKTDHFYRSVEEFKRNYKGTPPFDDTTRLDLITPPRSCFVRFGAISVYLGYRFNEKTPSFYVLEAGTAVGNPKTIYASPSFDNELRRYTDYKPTPFTHKSHIYVAKLSLNGDSPGILTVQAHKKPGQSPYMRLTVNFTETTKPNNVWPGLHILRAAAIVESRMRKVPRVPV